MLRSFISPGFPPGSSWFVGLDDGVCGRLNGLGDRDSAAQPDEQSCGGYRPEEDVAVLVTAHVARVKALPPDYQIVYKEMQKYLFKVGPVILPDGPLLPWDRRLLRGGRRRGRGSFGTHRHRCRCVL